MIILIAKISLLAAIFLWPSFYIGSLTPQLWRQKNYRGAVGVAALACMILIFPLVITLIRSGRTAS